MLVSLVSSYSMWRGSFDRFRNDRRLRGWGCMLTSLGSGCMVDLRGRLMVR